MPNEFLEIVFGDLGQLSIAELLAGHLEIHHAPDQVPVIPPRRLASILAVALHEQLAVCLKGEFAAASACRGAAARRGLVDREGPLPDRDTNLVRRGPGLGPPDDLAREIPGQREPVVT